MSTLEDLKPWVFFFFTTFVPCKTTPSFLFLHFSECLSMCTVGMCRVFFKHWHEKRLQGVSFQEHIPVSWYPTYLTEKPRILHSSRPSLVHPNWRLLGKATKRNASRRRSDGPLGKHGGMIWSDRCFMEDTGPVTWCFFWIYTIRYCSRVSNMMITLLFHTKHDILCFCWHI